MTALVALLAVVVGLLGILVAGLLRSHAEVLRTLHDMGVNLDPSAPDDAVGGHRTAFGVPSPRRASGAKQLDVTGTTPGGDQVFVAIGGTGRLTLLAFLSSTCLTCRGFWEAFGAPDLDVPGRARLVVVAKGPEAESPAMVERLAPRDVTVALSSEAWDAYAVPGAPYFVLVDGRRDTVIGEGAATAWDQVRGLMEQSLLDAGSEGPARERHVDAQLRAAGIEPGDPSLYPGGEVEGEG